MELKSELHVPVGDVDRVKELLVEQGLDGPLCVRHCGDVEGCRVIVANQRWHDREWKSEKGAEYERILREFREALA